MGAPIKALSAGIYESKWSAELVIFTGKTLAPVEPGKWGDIEGTLALNSLSVIEG
jgi:hypothetical protein